MDVVGLYPNIPHDVGPSSLRKRLESRKEKYVSTDTIIDLAEVVLKNNIFTFGKKTLKQKRGTTISAKFTPPYSILFMAKLEKEALLRGLKLKLGLTCRDEYPYFHYENAILNI